MVFNQQNFNFFVTFFRISHAAKAYEGCDRSFKPVFADPRPQKPMSDERYSGHGSTTGPCKKIANSLRRIYNYFNLLIR